MITLTLNSYQGPPACGNHLSTDWQIATDPGFTNIINESLADAVNLLTYSYSSSTYYSKLYGRARFNLDNCVSNWAVVTLNNDPDVVNEILRPVINFDSGTSVLTTTPFQTVTNIPPQENHISTDWKVKDSNSAIVHESLSDAANLISLDISGVSLVSGDTYAAFARHNGDTVKSNYGGVLFTAP